MYYFITFLTTENVEGENVVLSGQLTYKRRADGWGVGEKGRLRKAGSDVETISDVISVLGRSGRSRSVISSLVLPSGSDRVGGGNT